MSKILRDIPITKQSLDNTHYLHHLTRVLVSMAQYGHAVILGRGANYILPPESGLRVRVVAPLEVRRLRLMHEQGYDAKKAAHEIGKHDEEHHDFLQHHFHCKSEEMAYDVVINTAHIETAAAADWIVQLAFAKLKKLILKTSL